MVYPVAYRVASLAYASYPGFQRIVSGALTTETLAQRALLKANEVLAGLFLEASLNQFVSRNVPNWKGSAPPLMIPAQQGPPATVYEAGPTASGWSLSHAGCAAVMEGLYENGQVGTLIQWEQKADGSSCIGQANLENVVTEDDVRMYPVVPRTAFITGIPEDYVVGPEYERDQAGPIGPLPAVPGDVSTVRARIVPNVDSGFREVPAYKDRVKGAVDGFSVRGDGATFERPGDVDELIRRVNLAGSQPVIRLRAGVQTFERKPKIGGTAGRVYLSFGASMNEVTENIDLVGAFWRAVPEELRTPGTQKTNAAQMMIDIVRAWEEHPELRGSMAYTAAFNVASNQLQDMVIGKVNGQIARDFAQYVRAPVGPHFGPTF